VFDLGKPVVDLMLSTDTVKDVLEGIVNGGAKPGHWAAQK